MGRAICLGSAVLLSLLGAAVDAGPTDESIRPLSSRALQALLSAAELRLGIGSVTYEWDSAGRYIPSYESSVCPVRGKSRLEALVAAGHPEVERELRELGQLADLDGSGSISDAEALSIAEIIDFGFRSMAAAERAGLSGTAIAQLMGLREDELVRRLTEYEGLRTRSARSGIHLPAPPSPQWKKP